jgi:hypothetical protein
MKEKNIEKRIGEDKRKKDIERKRTREKEREK